MQKTLPVEPISTIQKNPSHLLSLIETGPVILAQRSTGVAVVTSVAEWDRLAERMARYERAALADEAMAEIEAGHYVTGEEFEAELKRLGIE